MRTCRVILTAVAVAVVFAGGWVAGRADNSFSEDGPGWRAVSKECKLLYVDGYDAGYRAGGTDDSSDWIQRLLQASIAKQITTKQWKQIEGWKLQPGDAWTEKMSWTGWAQQRMTNGEVEEGIDRFYQNPANQAVCWWDAFTIVSHSIAGQTFSEADMSAIRAAGHGCR